MGLEQIQLNVEVPEFEIRFPARGRGYDQDEEWFEVRLGDEWQRMRLHDYDAIYKVPGLYEALIYEALECKSPPRVVGLLKAVLEDWPATLPALRILDLGAGNGIVAECLKSAGARYIVGADILPEAREAAERDRPDVYADYIVGDITSLSGEPARRLREAELDCLVSVAALGFGDIPPQAFAAAFNVIGTPGWVAFTIKETFLSETDTSGFSKLIRRLIAKGSLRVEAHRRYCHRRSIEGEKLFYVAIVARKLSRIEASDLVGDAGPTSLIGLS
jgi:SAM-dependent methyltransferase